MKRLLILSPRFPPTNAPDHQRVRMMLPHLEEFGWQATVLAVHPECIEGGVPEPLLEQGLPAGLRVQHVRALPPRLTRLAGLGSLSVRAWPFLAHAGAQLLQQNKFDRVFFSTTEFPLMAFGPRWFRTHRVPYILDIQDPWVSDYYHRHPGAPPPGGTIKHALSQWLARRLEPQTLNHAAHVVCVSPSYPPMFLKRYLGLHPAQFSVLPFGATESDLRVANSPAVKQPIFQPGDARQHWVYAGRAGPDMAFSLRALFQALHRAAAQNPQLRHRLTLHFVGTDYAPAGLARKTVQPLAQDCGVADMVTEQPQRLPYFQALRCLSDADALIVPGSDDPGYTASKIYPYILARKPLLAIFHQQSSVVDVLRRTRAGTVVTFASGSALDDLADRIVATQWLENVPVPQTDWAQFESFTARQMTRRLCTIFDNVLKANDASRPGRVLRSEAGCSERR